MKRFGILLLVAAFSAYADASEKIERYAVPPFPVRKTNSTAASSKKANGNTQEQQTSASELSPNSIAHQLHAQRVAAEQQARISKLAFGSNPPSTTLVATSLHQASRGHGEVETSPIAYSVIRQRPASHGPTKRFSTVAQTQPAVHYHPVMRYMTFIQHPGAQLQIPIQTHSLVAQQPLVSPQQAYVYSSLPVSPPPGPYSSSPYAGGKLSSKYISGPPKAPSPSPSSSPYRLVSSTKSVQPPKFPKSPYASSSSSGAPNALIQSEQPISRPLYSPAAVPLPSKYASQSAGPPSSLRDPEPDPESYPPLPGSSANDPSQGGPTSYVAEYHSASPIQEYHYTVPSSASSGPSNYEPQGEVQQLVPLSLSPETMREIYGEASKVHAYAPKSQFASSPYAASVSAPPQASDPDGGEAPPPSSPYAQQVYSPYTSPAYSPYLQGQRPMLRVVGPPPGAESGPPGPAPGQLVRYSSSTIALSPVHRSPSPTYPVSSYGSGPSPKSKYEGASLGSAHPQLASYFSPSAGQIPQSQYQKLLAQSGIAGISDDGAGNGITDLIPEISSIYSSPYKR